MLFHEYLREIIKSNGGKSKAVNKGLATYLGVPQSTVTRWLQSSDYLPHFNQVSAIIAYFSLTPADAQKLRDAHDQSQIMDKDKVYPGNEGEVGEAVNSLIQSATGRKTHLLDVTKTPVDLAFLVASSASIFYDERILERTTDILIGILQRRPEILPSRPGTILMTRQGKDLGESFPDIREEWKNAVLLLLQEGWTVKHLIRFNPIPSEQIKIIDDMLDYLKYGNYHPCYFNTYGLTNVPSELFIIPDVMAMVQLDTSGAGFANGGMLLHEPGHIRFYEQHFEILQQQTTPLLTAYRDSWQDRAAYLRFVEKAETAHGDRYIQKSFGGLSQVTQPLTWMEPGSLWWRAMNLPVAEMHDIAAHREHCYAAFKKHMDEGCSYYDICDMKKIREQALEGKYYPYYDTNTEAVLPVSARIDHLMHAIAMLDRYPTYSIALLDDDEVNRLPRDVFWEVAGEKYTLIEVETGREDYVTVSIEEPLIAAAFTSYSSTLWKKEINPLHYDHRYVRQQLEDLCKELRTL